MTEKNTPNFDEKVIVGALATIADRVLAWVLREPFDIASPGLIDMMLERGLLGATISPAGRRVVQLSKKGMEMLRAAQPAPPAKSPVPDLRPKPVAEQVTGTVAETEELLQEEKRVRGVLGLLESRTPHDSWTHVGECALSEIFHAKDYEAGGLLDEMIEAGIVEAEDFGSVRHIRITGKGLDVLDRSNGKIPPEPDKSPVSDKRPKLLVRPEDVGLDDTDMKILSVLVEASPVAPAPKTIATGIGGDLHLVFSCLDRMKKYQLVDVNSDGTAWTITERGRVAFSTPAAPMPSDSERRLGSLEIGPLPSLDRSKMPIENILMDNDDIAMLNLLRKSGDSAGRDLAKCCAVAADGVLVLKRLREYGLLTLAAPGYYDDPGARWKLTPRGSDMVSRIAQKEQEYDHGVEQADIERRYVEDTALGERIAEARERQSRRPRPEKPYVAAATSTESVSFERILRALDVLHRRDPEPVYEYDVYVEGMFVDVMAARATCEQLVDLGLARTIEGKKGVAITSIGNHVHRVHNALGNVEVAKAAPNTKVTIHGIEHDPTPGTIVTYSHEEKELAERDWKTLRDATRILRGTDPRLAAQVEEAATDLADLIIAIGERVKD